MRGVDLRDEVEAAFVREADIDQRDPRHEPCKRLLCGGHAVGGFDLESIQSQKMHQRVGEVPVVIHHQDATVAIGYR